MQYGNIRAITLTPLVGHNEIHRSSRTMSLRKLNIRRILIYSAILSLFIYFILAWAEMIADHYQRTGSDFMGFYSFGWIAKHRGIQYLYDLKIQQDLQETIVGHPVTPIFHAHVPLTALF